MFESRRSAPARALVGTLLAIACGLLLLPAAAQADGPVTPVATNYLARVTSAPAGLEAKVADGYLTLWVQATPSDTVIVKDFKGAPWVRFTPAGVWINHRSQSYYLSQIPVPETPPPGLTAQTPPRWFKVSSGHSYEWREGRMHALADIALPPGQTYAGQWRIPVTVNGHAATITGGLWRSDKPSIAWFWPIAVILVCLLAAWRVRSVRLDALLRDGLVALLLVCLAVAVVARNLHGRPVIQTAQITLLVVELLVLLVVAARQASGRAGRILPFGVALVAIWAGLTMLTSLTHPYVLTALPAVLIRIVTVVLLGAGLGLVAFASRAVSGRTAAALAATTLLAGCGSAATVSVQSSGVDPRIPSSLLAKERPIGRGTRFTPTAHGPIPGPCESRLGPRAAAHVELFGADKVVLLAAGIGTGGPRRTISGRIVHAGCFGSLVTLDPTGTVYFRPSSGATIGALFRAWGQPLSATRIASFTGGRVRIYVNGHPRSGAPSTVPLRAGDEIVLEIGPYVPPHTHFTFPPRAPAAMS
jgi:hypothetical protein